MIKFFLIFLFAVFLSGSVLASEKSIYNFSWLDKDKEIYVLQNRRFRKDGQVYVGALGVKTLSGAFIDSYGGSARGGYFFSEDWGIELALGKSSGNENDTAKGVFEQGGSVAYYRKIDSYTGGMLMWSPFYSKINTFNQIFYFDWMLGLGVASVKTLDNRNRFTPGANTKQLTSENLTGAMWNTGLRVYFSDHWSVRIDLTGLHFSAKKSREDQNNQSLDTSKMFHNYDLGIGLNYGF